MIVISPIFSKSITTKWPSVTSKSIRYYSSHNKRLAFSVLESGSHDNKKKKTPLIVLHGLFGNKNIWRGLLQLPNCGILSRNDGRKAYLLDARNHGESFHDPIMTYEAMAHDLEQFIVQQGLDRVILLGHSMGGKQIMQLIINRYMLGRSSFANHFEIEKAIILDIAPVSYTSNNLWTIPTIVKAMDELPLDFTTENRTRSQVDALLARYIPDKRIRLFIATNLERRSNGTGWNWIHNHKVIRDNISHMGGFPENSLMMATDIGMPCYDGPVLFIRGGNSFYCHPPYLSEIERLFPNYRMETVPNAGHWVHSDNPEQFSQIVHDFINEDKI